MKIGLLIYFILSLLSVHGQTEQTYQVRTIAFYNLENLFDTKNDTLTFDDDRTPEGKDNWTDERYQKKLHNMAQTLSEIGSSNTGTAPDIIGICEVENIEVIQDLLVSKSLKNLGYEIVHYDSPDERGIDVALLYKENAFLPASYASHRLILMDENEERNYTRDQLVVGGRLDNEQMYFIVNHWPSRSGGEARSEPNRLAAAHLNKRIIDSIQKMDSQAKIISMGDFNDDPNNRSFKKVLKTKANKRKLQEGELFNPMEKLFKKGVGSLAYRDKWNLFDQIYFTESLVNNENKGYQFWKAGIFNPAYLVTQKGRYKGYPFRTYSGGNYTGGYSDHFPVYIYLLRKPE
ncbi:endonuclease/exonuclease/phosphatase family protein [Euzebyella marina]|uniref:Endonuclease/exonuclease/phosphatase family protein n=1 Tax=Euzebyella marina TaxID=1761453 RepID=A0A3G2LB52_9FLAO|nr:endonuclease/exonuclease/phosphatase family protein [Euzebyella marina]AYN69496.1 endonuclease/exonuclease/phosphatase family protein [Euzebyella marina]